MPNTYCRWRGTPHHIFLSPNKNKPFPLKPRAFFKKGVQTKQKNTKRTPRMLTHLPTTKQPAMEGQTDPNKGQGAPNCCDSKPPCLCTGPCFSKTREGPKEGKAHTQHLQKAKNWGGPFPLNLHIFKPLHPELFRPSASDLQALNSPDPLSFQFSSF